MRSQIQSFTRPRSRESQLRHLFVLSSLSFSFFCWHGSQEESILVIFNYFCFFYLLPPLAAESFFFRSSLFQSINPSSLRLIFRSNKFFFEVFHRWKRSRSFSASFFCPLLDLEGHQRKFQQKFEARTVLKEKEEEQSWK